MTQAKLKTQNYCIKVERLDSILEYEPSQLQCALCLNVLSPQSYKCSTCQILICLNCKQCKTHGKKDTLSNQEQSKIIKQLSYKCFYSNSGCSIVSKSQQEDFNHYLQCEYSNDVRICPHCKVYSGGLQKERYQFELHLITCVEQYILCNICCKISFKKKELQQHQAQCSKSIKQLTQCQKCDQPTANQEKHQCFDPILSDISNLTNLYNILREKLAKEHHQKKQQLREELLQNQKLYEFQNQSADLLCEIHKLKLCEKCRSDEKEECGCSLCSLCDIEFCKMCLLQCSNNCSDKKLCIVKCIYRCVECQEVFCVDCIGEKCEECECYTCHKDWTNCKKCSKNLCLACDKQHLCN